MRKLLMVVALAALACGTSNGNSDLDSEPCLALTTDGGTDLTASFVGTWNGTSVNQDGTSISGFTRICKIGQDRLGVAEICGQGQRIPATVTSPTSFTLVPTNCISGSSTTCASVQYLVSGGSATISGNVITMQVTGTLVGCGGSNPLNYTLQAVRQ